MSDGPLYPAIIFGTAAFISWVVANNIRRTKQVKLVADLHTRVLDKCAASQDLLAYMESEAGRKFLDATSERADAASKILDAVRAGIVLSFTGLAELILHAYAAWPDGAEILTVTGTILVAIGLGFVASAATSYGLCKSWGLLPAKS
jgi:hypothetical protein